MGRGFTTLLAYQSRLFWACFDRTELFEQILLRVCGAWVISIQRKQSNLFDPWFVPRRKSLFSFGAPLWQSKNMILMILIIIIQIYTPDQNIYSYTLTRIPCSPGKSKLNVVLGLKVANVVPETANVGQPTGPASKISCKRDAYLLTAVASKRDLCKKNSCAVCKNDK